MLFVVFCMVNFYLDLNFIELCIESERIKNPSSNYLRQIKQSLHKSPTKFVTAAADVNALASVDDVVVVVVVVVDTSSLLLLP